MTTTPLVAPPPVTPWHAEAASAVTTTLAVVPQTGLTETEAATRFAQHGPNQLTADHHESLWETLSEEVREPMILLLLGTGVLYSLWGGLGDALTIFAVIVVVVGSEILNERRAATALAALRQLADPAVRVRRAGTMQAVPATAIVPGDILLLEEGQRVAADARLLSGGGVQADESSLTGESVPADKDPQATVATAAPLAERPTMLYAGTTITRGRGEAVVVATGMATELGQVATLAAGVPEPRTPLQRTMRELTRWMVWLALGFSTLVPLLGWLFDRQPLREMILTGLSLAFATIPEELPILITIVLALGAYHLSQQRAIVKRLRAAETLSAVTVIATDKTGTLTQNRMRVSMLFPPEQQERVLALGVYCNTATATTGDPLEIALLQAAEKAGWDLAARRGAWPLHAEFPFDAQRKTMALAYTRDGGVWVAVKGAPEVILAHSTTHRLGAQVVPLTAATRQDIVVQIEHLTATGQRVIALAEGQHPAGPLTRDTAERDLTFVGLVGLSDPPRPEVAAAIRTARDAGIRLLMVTGDHPHTALAIARAVGLATDGRVVTGPELDATAAADLPRLVREVQVFARTTPAHKLRIVQTLQAGGARVAVTGDGVNDAPALAAADIGIAMGQRGTDVARAAADIILADDNFATITRAVAEGRLLYANLQKAIRYYLACKVALVAATMVPVLLHVPVPFAPVQIILMELFLDVAASATFVSERAEVDLMRQPPRDARAPFMSRAFVTSIFTSAAGLFAAVTVAYLVTWYGGADLAHARTVAFVTWLLGHVLLALHLRSDREPLTRLGLFTNRVMVLWLGAVVAFCLVIGTVPGVATLFKTTPLALHDWLLAGGAALLGTSWLEVAKHLRSSRRTLAHPQQQMRPS